MKITCIRLGMLRVPLRTPFRPALRTVDSVDDVVVAIHADTGHIGQGSAPATAVITGDPHGGIVTATTSLTAPRLRGGDSGDLDPLVDRVQTALVRNSSTNAAVEIARYALFARVHGMECMIEIEIRVSAPSHLQVARTEVITGIDLDGPSLCMRNPVAGAAHVWHRASRVPRRADLASCARPVSNRSTPGVAPPPASPGRMHASCGHANATFGHASSMPIPRRPECPA